MGMSWTPALTTYRRDGRAVVTPVSMVLDAGHGYFVTAVDSGKVRRLARDDRVVVNPRAPGQDSAGRGRAGPAPRRPLRVLSPASPVPWSGLLFLLRGHRVRLYAVDFD